ncbi:hypothetical protein TBLA_0C06170 [Henningerozyma blattae CBS 6284]|uniref:Cytochrome c oxidase assembly protein COX16, mitochondrial n=1 Tax=Henningerozyma blattae (strain ATCC 34711 / CBS 6284 / DSM 70876 / NBRC 10599 / NRRL Y-10934 / UCD 77-7) TaxID=1071380 RepID=I2H211_HENB6|nr:hypothetical protein TBLA_0C06170 [Tetrapisispora blattae CBS 6284]CCH60413.1 hypothetical protein TBLA_0C06170 [Tetrapisispora blattae CBS 6284]
MALNGRTFKSKRQQRLYNASIAGKYQKLVNRNPFLFFGLPFCGLIVAGSYWLSEFTAVKYEREDARVQELNEEDLIKMKSNERPFDIKEEYYRLQGLQDEDWEPVRVKRLKGESENVW